MQVVRGWRGDHAGGEGVEGNMQVVRGWRGNMQVVRRWRGEHAGGVVGVEYTAITGALYY